MVLARGGKSVALARGGGTVLPPGQFLPVRSAKFAPKPSTLRSRETFVARTENILSVFNIVILR